MPKRTLSVARRVLLLCALMTAHATWADPWELPPEGSCQPSQGLHGWPMGEDAPPIPFKPGDVLDHEKLPILVDYLPQAIWKYRARFFFEGMRLEIGACFRDYSPPPFYMEATEKFRGQPKLNEAGGLENYVAGLPFPPDSIGESDPLAGQKWAWNAAHRYQAGGMWADEFRISDLVGRVGRAEPFLGEIFKAQLRHRADRADHGYQEKNAKSMQWVAGGKFFMPQPAREFAWRQYRDVENQREPERSDDLHAYLPDWRRVRRLNASGVEGFYLPAFSVGTVPAQTLTVPGGDGAAGSAGVSAGITAGSGTIQTKRSGFEGLEVRPLLYENEVLGVQDVLTPINASNPSFPAARDRAFGPWGLSFASDRWDLRRALVIEGRARKTPGGQHTARFIKYVDLQTLVPLYYMAYDARDELIDLGMFVGRWSEDRPDYPRWNDDAERPVRVIDSVGASFANLAESGSWRRESWEMTAIPPSEKKLRRLLSVGSLTRGK